MKAQYGILRFKKYKGPAISPIEAHNERTKEQYASNPDIDTSRSRYNLHLVQPQGRYREEADRMIAAAHCRVRKDSVRVVEALVTASPEFFKGKTHSEVKAYSKYALISLRDLPLKNSGLTVTRASTTRTLSLRTRQWAAAIMRSASSRYLPCGCTRWRL